MSKLSRNEAETVGQSRTLCIEVMLTKPVDSDVSFDELFEAAVEHIKNSVTATEADHDLDEGAAEFCEPWEDKSDAVAADRDRLFAALSALTLTPDIQKYLQQYDPKALQQALAALGGDR